MNQLSSVPFGTDANVLAGYAQHANASLGNLDIIIENTGANQLSFQVKEFDGTTAPSGYANVGGMITVVPRGSKTVSYNLVSQRVGFFGSGSTVANLSLVYRNKGDLRDAQIDLVATGRRGWGFDRAFSKPTLTKGWGNPPDSPNDASEEQQEGGIGL